MAHTVIQPASAMQSTAVRTIKGDIQGLSYTQIPGGASAAAAAPDGSLWVLSTQPSGPDKYIWHYSSGSWSNISGLASRISVGPNGDLYAINSGGGAYLYTSGVGTWTALAGGCRDLSAAADGSLYIVSSGGGTDGAIWHFANGGWAQQPGSGNRITASWDTQSYNVPGGTIAPGGFYVINSQGSIYYLGASGYIQLPGAGSAIAPIPGGLFALGYPNDPNGNALYYYDLNNPGWSAKGGSGASLSSNTTTLYVIGSSGAIYSAAISPVPQNYLPISNQAAFAGYEALPNGGWVAGDTGLATLVQPSATSCGASIGTFGDYVWNSIAFFDYSDLFGYHFSYISLIVTKNFAGDVFVVGYKQGQGQGNHCVTPYLLIKAQLKQGDSWIYTDPGGFTKVATVTFVGQTASFAVSGTPPDPPEGGTVTTYQNVAQIEYGTNWTVSYAAGYGPVQSSNLTEPFGSQLIQNLTAYDYQVDPTSK